MYVIDKNKRIYSYIVSTMDNSSDKFFYFHKQNLLFLYSFVRKSINTANSYMLTYKTYNYLLYLCYH